MSNVLVTQINVTTVKQKQMLMILSDATNTDDVSADLHSAGPEGSAHCF